MRLRRRPAEQPPARPVQQPAPWDRTDLEATTAWEPPLLHPRTVTAAVAVAVTFVLALVMLFVSPPYVIQSPGPTVDTLGDIGDEPLIAVEDAETYPTEGELRLTTVSTRGGPGFPTSTAEVIQGWLSGVSTVVPREAAFEPDQTREEVNQQSTLQMSSSQTNATVSALTALGHDVPMDLWAAGTTTGGPAEGAVEAEDLLQWISVDGERAELTEFAVLAEVLAATAPGTTVTLGIEREGQEMEVEVTTADDGDGGSVLGVLIAPDVDLPIDIDFAIENIGGPSGGLMLALGIVDVLTPAALTGGAVVAGTGTIDLAGDVGPIGGIPQKLVGAERDDADWFLAPVENCAEVTAGGIPAGLEVVAVDTLGDAVSALEDISAGRTGDLPRCPAP